MPYVFTEHGALMAAAVLNTPLAVDISVYVVRAFVKMREIVLANQQLAEKLDELDRRVSKHDKTIAEIIEAIRQLMLPAETSGKRPIGFAPWKDDA